MRVRVPLPAPNKINSIFLIVIYYASNCRTSTLPPLRDHFESMFMVQQPDLTPKEEIQINDLSWMDKTLGWGTRARPELNGGGLTIDAINVGVYADIPDRIHYRNRRPRGAWPVDVGNIGGYYLQDKYEQWADVAGLLYEETISRRWSTATEIPWASITETPKDLELAICQVATELCQQASVESEVISGWLQNLSPGYHEVKIYLSTAIFDSARMFDGYRKRAMVNGGGMLLESPGKLNRLIYESYAGWSETVLAQYIMRGSFQKNILRYLSVYGPTEADRILAWRILSDRTRSIAYAIDHIRFAISQVPALRDTLGEWLTRVELVQLDEARDHVLWEALAVIFGGGVRNIDTGMSIVNELKRDWIRDYLQYLKTAGIDRANKIPEPMQKLISENIGTSG